MRVKGGVVTRRRHKRTLDAAEGYKGRRKNCFRLAKLAVQKAGVYAYRDRKVKKRAFRSLWIVRINARAREFGLSYSNLMMGLRKANIGLDRKVLADIALRTPESFRLLVEQAKAAL